MFNDVTQLDLVFAALAHPKRRAMVDELSLGPATIQRLAHNHDMSLPAIHKHIRAMEEAGLIVRRKSGRTNFVALGKSALYKAQCWVNQYRAEWGNDQETLENYIDHLNDK